VSDPRTAWRGLAPGVAIMVGLVLVAVNTLAGYGALLMAAPGPATPAPIAALPSPTAAAAATAPPVATAPAATASPA
jgi:hypothetical protein